MPARGRLGRCLLVSRIDSRHHFTIRQQKWTVAVSLAAVDKPPKLMDTMKVRHLELVSKGQLVQWAVVEDGNTVFVAFKGSDANISDVISSLGAIPVQHPVHGLYVHTCVHTSLQAGPSEELGVAGRLSAILQQVARRRSVVLCGHSLGGGYALLVALELLHANSARVAAVMTFGSPHVVVPSVESRDWKRLSAITCHFINSWDAVARIPSQWEWLEGTVKSVLSTLEVKTGPVKVGVPFAEGVTRKVIDHLHATYAALKDRVAKYDTVGAIYFLSPGVAFTMCVPTDGRTRSHHEYLRKTPEEWGWFVFEQHSSIAYLSVLTELIEHADGLRRAGLFAHLSELATAAPGILQSRCKCLERALGRCGGGPLSGALVAQHAST